MRLYEFDPANSLIPKIVAVSDQLKSDLSDEQLQSGMTVDELLTYFQKYDIVLDKMDLINMMKKPPLKNMISNIQGDHVEFKGAGEDAEADDQQDNQNIVASMADRAANKHQ
jgi:hypothetical protein